MEVPHGTKWSRCIDETIEDGIKKYMHLEPEDFNLMDWNRNEIEQFINKINESYIAREDRIYDKILWDDFYFWWGNRDKIKVKLEEDKND